MATNGIKRIVFCAYGENREMRSSQNIDESSDRGDIYWKNAVVSLCSVKSKEPECDVAIVTNTDVPEKFLDIFHSYEILVFKEPFDEFLFDNKTTWGLAFYKLCALKKIIQKEYDYICMMDLDTFTQTDFNDMWDECRYYIMLHDRHPRLRIAKQMYSEIRLFTGQDRPYSLWGGELIAGSNTNLSLLMNEMDEVYRQMITKNFVTEFGDEFIICVAADKLKTIIKNADGYVSRYWTGTFRGMNTSYKYDPVSILHVPAEKNDGMISLYQYFSRKHTFPNNRKVHRMLHLNHPSFTTRVKIFAKAIMNMLKVRN